MRRKFLSVVLCVCMMLTMVPFAFAEGDSTTELNISSGGASGGGSVTPVAQVGDMTYGTLRDAVAAVPENGTVTLLKDATGSGIGTYSTDKDGNTKITSKSFTIDFNGHTYSLNTPAVGSTGYETQGFHFEWKGSAENIPNITLKNGTLDVASEHDSNLKLLIQNYCNLTLDSMIVDGSNLENGWGTYTYITSNCCGTTVIKDTKIFGGDAQKNVAFDVDGCRSAYANTPVKITVEGNSEILGRIEVNDSDNKSENTLTVKGGSFTDVATAVKYAENNATIKVAQDTTSDVVVPADKTITLDLNGKKLTNVSSNTITNNGTLTITGTGTVDNVTHQKAALYNKGTATVEGGTYTRSAEASSATNSGNNSYYVIDNYGTLTINKGTFKFSDTNAGAFSSLIHNGWYDGSQNTSGQNAVMTINDGNFTQGTGGKITVKNDDYGKLEIKGGVFTQPQSNYYCVYNYNIAKISGGTINGYVGNEYASTTTYDKGLLEISNEAVINGGIQSRTKANQTSSNDQNLIKITDNAKVAGAITSVDAKYVTVSGGYFTSDPTPYCGTKDGKQLTGVASKDSSYPYTVGEKNAESKPATVDSATVPAKAASSDATVQEAANSISGAKLENSASMEAAVKDIANNNKFEATSNTTGESTVLSDLQKVDSSVTSSDNVSIVYQTYIDITVTDAEKDTDKFSELAVNLTPMYRVVATKQDNVTSDATLVTEGDGQNAVLIQEGKQLNNVPVKNYEVKLALPTDFANAGDKLSIKHTKENGSIEYYTGTVTKEGTDPNTKTYVTFTTNGFSPFVIYAASANVASIGEGENQKVYPTLQAAIDAVQNNETITLLKDTNENVTVSKAIKFTLAGKDHLKGSIAAGSRYSMTTSETNGNTEYTFTYVGGGSSSSISTPTTYAVNVNAATNGAVAADKKTASKGTTVTVTASPSKGYVVDGVKVVDKDGKDVAVTGKDGKYVFTMPGSAVTVTGSFKAETPVALPFTDVKSGDWFYPAVQYAYAQGLMTGTSATTFAPNGTMNRAMIVTVLYRLEKSPAVTGASKFTDVPAGQWYSDAVAWAAANKIVNGYDETTFGPMNAVTREQMAAILFRYEQVKGLENVTLEENLNRFPDQNKISAYAIPALQWAVGQKIINGNADGTLDPTGTATRAQVAQIFTNLLNK